jgi:hypothetical protein
MNNIPRIRVCVPYPNHGVIAPETLHSLALLKACPDFFVEVMEIQGSSISVLRNIGINKGSSERKRQVIEGFDYYLSVDADIVFTPEHLKQLIKQDLDIVGAAYQYRVSPDLIVAGFFDSCEGDVRVENFLSLHVSGLKEVDWIGAGFTLIRKHVLDSIEYPWYRELIVEFEDRGELCARWVGEDVGFCMAARKNGFKIYCDCDCRVRHLIGNSKNKTIPIHGMEKEIYTLDEAASAAISMLDNVKFLVKGFHQGLKEIEQRIGTDTISEKTGAITDIQK